MSVADPRPSISLQTPRQTSPSSPVLAETTLYKGTTLPHFVVERRAELLWDGFFTFQQGKDSSSKKWWGLHPRCSIEPADASSIRAHERHLRRAGPLRTVAAYARDKNVLKLYCFRVTWPDMVAPAPGTTAELYFDTLEAATEWHGLVQAQLQELRAAAAEANGGGLTRFSAAARSSLQAAVIGRSSMAEAYPPGEQMLYFTPRPLTSPPSPQHPPGVFSSVSSQGPAALGPCSSYVSTGQLAGSLPTTSSLPAGSSSSPDLLATMSGSTPAAADTTPPAGAGAGAGAAAATPAGGGGGRGPQQQQAAGGREELRVQLPREVRPPASATTAAAAALQRMQQLQGGQVGCASDVQPAGAGGDLCLVPYKHSNGMAVYFRQTVPGEGLSEADGEYMLSAVIQASPERCVSALTQPKAAASAGAVLSTAAYMELLEQNGDMQVWHMLFPPAGGAGGWGWAAPLVAPREAFLQQVTSMHQEGVYNVLFSSIPQQDIQPTWQEAAAARMTRATQALAASHPGLASLPWCRRPVRCRLRGAFTFGALEGYGRRDSPLTLVTVVLQADFGGWLGSSSRLHHVSQVLGLQEALVDRVLMQVMVLKEAVENCRFKTKPFELLMQHHLGEQQQQQQQVSEQEEEVQEGAASPACAAAAAAAARMSPSAARELQAHMTDPQQLWKAKQDAYQQQAGGPAASTGSGPLPRPLLSSPTTPSPSPAAAAGGGQWRRTKDAGDRAGAADPDAAVRSLTPDQMQKQQLALAAAEGLSAAAPAPEGDRLHTPTATPTPLLVVGGFNGAGHFRHLRGPAGEEDGYDSDGESLFTAAEDLALSSDSLLSAAAAMDSSSSNVAQPRPGPNPYSVEECRALLSGTLNKKYWEAIHDGRPGDGVFAIRGKNYLTDRKKYLAGQSRYKLMAAELAATRDIVPHISRFLPSVRCTGAAFNFVVDLIIPGDPVLHLVMVFGTDRHPAALGPCPDDPLDAGEEWTPFDFTMSRFLHGSDEERNSMFKLIPHVAKGSWILSQSVGTTPVIMGRKLNTNYFITERYVELSIDVTTNPAVSYIVRMVQGATRSMVIDHGYLLEGQYAHELPEMLVGAIKFKHLDMTDATPIQTQQELPFGPVIPGVVGR